MKMKFLFFFEFVFLFNTIKGDANPFLIVPREQELSQPLMMGKTIIISGKTGQINTEDPNVMQTVMNVVNNRFKSDNNGKDMNGNEIPEVIITDSDPQKGQGLGQGASPLQSVQKIYNLPPMMRMIASEEATDNKKSSLWRSPIPFLHSEECPHKHHKKSKSGRKKARKHQKERVSSTTTTTTTTVKPVVEENREPLGSLLTSIISNAMFPSAPEFGSHMDGVRPPNSFSMSISHRIHPSHSELMEVPMLSEHRPRGFIAILHKRREPLPFAASQPEPQFMGPTGPQSPFNPFLALLSKLEEPVEPNMNLNFNSETEPKESNKDKGRKTNYNFNVNLTVNNYNYGQSDVKEVRPPFPLIFN